MIFLYQNTGIGLGRLDNGQLRLLTDTTVRPNNRLLDVTVQAQDDM